MKFKSFLILIFNSYNFLEKIKINKNKIKKSDLNTLRTLAINKNYYPKFINNEKKIKIFLIWFELQEKLYYNKIWNFISKNEIILKKKYSECTVFAQKGDKNI